MSDLTKNEVLEIPSKFLPEIWHTNRNGKAIRQKRTPLINKVKSIHAGLWRSGNHLLKLPVSIVSGNVSQSWWREELLLTLLAVREHAQTLGVWRRQTGNYGRILG